MTKATGPPFKRRDAGILGRSFLGLVNQGVRHSAAIAVHESGERSKQFLLALYVSYIMRINDVAYTPEQHEEFHRAAELFVGLDKSAQNLVAIEYQRLRKQHRTEHQIGILPYTVAMRPALQKYGHLPFEDGQYRSDGAAEEYESIISLQDAFPDL